MTGFILAGIGHRNSDGENFLVVKAGTTSDIFTILEDFKIISNIRH